MKYFIAFIFILVSSNTVAQISPDCTTAIPICNNTPVNSGTNSYGVDDFNGANTSGCLEKTLSGAIESNSAWYRFRTNATGQLGFNISIDTSEDWDFALYKSNDCNNLGTPVRCNFKDNKDENSFIGVGEDPTGNTNNNGYEAWLSVSPGEDYYLLINNFSNINSGFSIQFSGNIFTTNPYDALDCSIISNLLGPPIAACEADYIELDATTSDALSYSWYKNLGSGFVQIAGESNPTLVILDSAEYRVVVARAAGNIISDVQVGFTPNPMANRVSNKEFCYDENSIDLNAVDAEVLGAQNPQEFVVSYHSTFSDAVNNVNGLDKNHPKSSGTETIYIRVTSFENPKCYDVSQDFNIVVSEEIIQDFPSIVYLCEDVSTAILGDDTPNANYTYLWHSGETSSVITASVAGTYTLTISTNTGGITCSESFTIELVISNAPVISNVIVSDLQDNNTVTIETLEIGDYEYRIDNEAYQDSAFFENVLPGLHTFYVNDIKGCGIASETVVIVGFYKFFTPNGDGVNDNWTVEGLDTLDSPLLSIFDRYGKLIKQLNTSQPLWDGYYNGVQMPASDYWFQLSFLDTNGERVLAKYINNHFALKR